MKVTNNMHATDQLRRILLRKMTLTQRHCSGKNVERALIFPSNLFLIQRSHKEILLKNYVAAAGDKK